MCQETHSSTEVSMWFVWANSKLKDKKSLSPPGNTGGRRLFNGKYFSGKDLVKSLGERARSSEIHCWMNGRFLPIFSLELNVNSLHLFMEHSALPILSTTNAVASDRLQISWLCIPTEDPLPRRLVLLVVLYSKSLRGDPRKGHSSWALMSSVL